GLTGSDSTPSLLAECEGGTIAIDEYQNLEQDHQMLLRQILDRKPIPPTVGVGNPVVPDVRIVFAGNLEIDQAVSQKGFLHDLARRIRHRVITVPTLAERGEDVPYFVERFCPNRRSSPRFLYCLLNHSWGTGQVDELIQVLK